MKKPYDVVVIGAGSAGLTAAVGFSKVGKTVLLIEREHMGGECTNTGCIPSKALLHHAKSYYKAVKTAGSGPQSNAFRTEAFTYVREVVQNILDEETPETFEKIGIDVVLGEAEFTSTKTIKVNETEYSYKKAVIATGSSPRMLEIPGLATRDILTNQNLFTLDRAPERLLIIGAGPIGLEIGQAMAMLGSQVTIATIDSEFARLEDPMIRPILRNAFEKLGVNIRLQAFINRVEGKEAIFDIKNGEEIVSEIRVPFDTVLVAVGRVPNIPSGLSAATIEYTSHAITVDSQNRTTNKNVYAIGDVAERLKFTHTADDTARNVVAHAVSKGLIRANNRKAVPKVTYTTPEIAQVGLSWDAAVKKYSEADILRIEVPFGHNDRAKTEDTTEGMLIVIAKRLSGRVLGAHIIGPAAGELLSVFTIAIDQKISLWKLRSTIFAYPTYSLIIKKAGDYFFAQQIADLKPDLKRIAKRNAPKLVAGLLWIIALALIFKFQQENELSVLDTSLAIFDFISATIWGPVLYILIYTFRPLTFFPGTFLTILSGVFFGLWGGIIYTIVGANLSAALAYVVGRFFGTSLKLEDTALGNWVTGLRNEPFTTTLIARLIFLPFDLVNYAGGILKLPFWSYLSATIVGTLLGIATFVSIGASLDVEELRREGLITSVVDLTFIGLSVLIFVISIGVSRILKRSNVTA